MVAVPAVTPVTAPDEEPMVMLASGLLQVPPLVALVNVMVAASHTALGPEIVPTVGNEIILTVLVSVTEPQALDTAYDIVVVPNVTPVTIPVPLPTVALAVLLLVHVPPEDGWLKVIVDDWQTDDKPEMSPLLGAVSTVIVRVLAQPVPVVYDMMEVPPEIPLMAPVEVPVAVATAISVLLHVPAGVVHVSVITDPEHTVAGPLITAGVVNTVTPFVAWHAPIE